MGWRKRIHLKKFWNPSSQDLTHVQETLQLLSIMTNDNRFEEAYNTNTDQNRIEDAKRASEDKEYRIQLMKELGIS